MSAPKRRRRTAVWALGGLSIAVLGGAVAAYGYYSLDWGCLSSAEVARPFTKEELEAAFAKRGIELAPTDLPVTLPPGRYAYRYAAEGSTLFVVLCDGCRRRMPDVSGVSITVGSGPPQRMRFGWGLLNADIWVTDADGRSARRLIDSGHLVVSDLDRGPPFDSRCYVR
jgi:hypothetical protein